MEEEGRKEIDDGRMKGGGDAVGGVPILSRGKSPTLPFLLSPLALKLSLVGEYCRIFHFEIFSRRKSDALTLWQAARKLRV